MPGHDAASADDAHKDQRYGPRIAYAVPVSPEAERHIARGNGPGPAVVVVIFSGTAEDVVHFAFIHMAVHPEPASRLQRDEADRLYRTAVRVSVFLNAKLE